MSATTQEAPSTGRGLVVTQGHPRGVGPELLLRAAAAGALRAGDCVVADPDVVAALARRLATGWASRGWDGLRPLLAEAGRPGLGQVEALRIGVDLVLARRGAALVTAPIDKALARDEGFRHPGQTEYLAERAGGVEVAMFMVGPRLRVGLATIHVPLAEVPSRLDRAAIVKVGRLVIAGLQRHFAIDRPRLGVLGLNPHAGERGLLGDEEERVIVPAIEALRATHPGLEIAGPLPADTAFTAHLDGRFDALVAMYHDQGLGPFKLLHFSDGVNMTLGLPFVRTSPDHGTAMDIAGKGIADPSSMLAAIELARRGGA